MNFFNHDVPHFCYTKVVLDTRRLLPIFIALLAFVLSAPSLETSLEQTGNPLSPTDFVVDEVNNQIIVAHKTGHRVDFINKDTGQRLNSISTALPPTGLCLGGKGHAFITCSYSTSEVLVVDTKNHSVQEKLIAGHGAIAPVYSKRSNLLYVANQYDDDIIILDPVTKKEVSRIGVQRQPMAMDITPDGKWLYVANLLTATRADIDTVAADVTVIDLVENQVVKHLKLSNGSNALRGIKISPNGEHVFIAHNLGRFQVPTSQLEQGWMNTSALSIIDVKNQEVVAAILLDEPEKGAAGSWGIDANDDVIVVSHSGTHDYSIIDYQAMKEKLSATEDKESLSYDLRFLIDIRKRIPVKGNGPRAIKISGNQVFNALYFSDAIQIDELESGKNSAYYPLNPNLQIDSIRLGEMVFNDARYCFQQWQSCNGCHPNDARTDGLNWDLLNDGIGNPKNCKSMLYAHETPPAMISGIRPNAEIAVRAGFRHIQFAQIEEGNARAVDQYLRSLKPVPSPYLIDGQLSDNAKGGAKIFEKVKCNTCHSGMYYTDGKKHEIGTPGPADRTNTWDTPTLIEVWRTGPYLHDGRSENLKEMFVKDKHGLDYELSQDDLDKLIEYVLSL